MQIAFGGISSFLQNMGITGTGFGFAVAVLATWRLTHLLAMEDGPADIILRLRTRVGDGLIGQLMDCFNCVSLWIAAPVAFAVSQGPPLEWMLVWFARSGAACLLERIGQEAVTIHPASQIQQGAKHDGMLRTETTSLEKQADVHDEPS